jgi:hypothetical protein
MHAPRTFQCGILLSYKKVFLKETKLPLQTILSLLLLKNLRRSSNVDAGICLVLRPALSSDGCIFSIETLRFTGLSSSIYISVSKSCGLYRVSDSYASKLCGPLCLNASVVLGFLNSYQVKWRDDIKAIKKEISDELQPCRGKNVVHSLKLLQ